MEPDAIEVQRDPVDLLRYVDDLRHALTERVSHELRTPLTVVLGIAETIHRHAESLDADQLRQLTSRLQAQGFRLEGLLDDLLDLDRLARSVLAPVRELVDVAEVVRAATTNVPLEGRSLDLRLTPVTAAVDVPRVTRIVENLLANVRQHTGESTRAWVRVAPMGDGVLIEVGDDGPGIDEDLVGEVFEPFVQGQLRHPETPGMGIGLSLVRRFAELHGGRAWLGAPEGGHGTVVRVLIPEELPVSLAPARHVLRERKVLGDLAEVGSVVVETDPALVSILETLRANAGVAVVYLSEFTVSDQVVLALAGDGSGIGIHAGRRIPLEDTFCVPMTEGRLPMAIPDTRAEPLLERLREVHPGIGAWCGVPVRLPDGSLYGSLCAAHEDPEVRVDEATVRLLASGAALLTHHLAVQRERLAERDARADRIRDVLLRRGVSTALQPIVDLASGEVQGVEALARFPDAKVRPPSAWFSDAERSGLGHELEKAALLAAAEQLPHVPNGGYVSCNASPELVVSGWLEQLAERIPPHRLVVEVTEHAAVGDYDLLAAALAPLREAGARLAVDDVGAGFASFRHVLDLEPDIIKIDRGLVSSLGDSPARMALMSGMVAFADRIGAKVVAEGLETAAEVTAVRDAGVPLGQGYVLCRPQVPPLPSRVDLAACAWTPAPL